MELKFKNDICENKLMDLIILFATDNDPLLKEQIFMSSNSLILFLYKIKSYKTINKKIIKLEKTGKQFHLERFDINNIIQDSKYKPFSYFFIKDFFKKIFGVDVFKDGETLFINKTGGRKDNLFILKKAFINFLELFTNIEELRNALQNELSNKNGNFIIEDKKESYLKFLILESYPMQSRSLIGDDNLYGYHGNLMDGSFLVFNDSKKEKLNFYKRIIFFKSDLNDFNVLNNNTLFL